MALTSILKIFLAWLTSEDRTKGAQVEQARTLQHDYKQLRLRALRMSQSCRVSRCGYIDQQCHLTDTWSAGRVNPFLLVPLTKAHCQLGRLSPHYSNKVHTEEILKDVVKMARMAGLLFES